MTTTLKTCTYFDGRSLCGMTPTNQYLLGSRCIDHTPAALAGRPETVPDLARTIEGLRLKAAEPSDIVITFGGVRF